MTEKLFDKDSHLREFTATVLECEEYLDKYSVVLDRTAFFYEGGGQASDRGFINNSAVLDVHISEGKIYHIMNSPLAVGSTVTGTLDWERRFDFMQQHSGEHIISGVAHSIYGCENVGFHLSEDIVTLDFDKPLNQEQINIIEKKANDVVFKNVPFFAYYPDESTLSVLKYRSKKEIDGDIRIVEIKGTDMCACCAPHVNFSGEIGIIKLLGFETLRGGVRIEMVCGNRALSDYKQKYDNIKKISSLLCVRQNETAVAVEKIQDNISQLKFEISKLKKQIIEEKIKSFIPKTDVTAHFEEDFTIKELQHLADSLFKYHGGVRATFSKTDNGFYFTVCGEESRLLNFFNAFKTEFSVKGGGRGCMVQGTVIAEIDKILEFFETF